MDAPPYRKTKNSSPDIRATTARPGGGQQGIGCTADVFVPIVVPIGIVDVFEVVEIDHHQSAGFEQGGERKKALHGVVERPAVIDVGQQVVVTIVFDLPLLGDFRGDVGDDAEIPFGSLDHLQPYPPGA